MKNIEVWVVKDPEGSVWSTPKGKSSWSSIGAAKNAWGCHNWKPHKKYKNLRSNCKWSEDADGWSCEMITEYEVTKK